MRTAIGFISARWNLSLLCSAIFLPLSIPAAEVLRVDSLDLVTPPPAATEAVDETPALWFVELASPPAADGTSLAQVRAEKANFRAAAQAAGLKYKERYAFDSLWNGLSVEINRNDLAALSRLAGVKTIYPVDVIPGPDPEAPPSPALFTSNEMIGANIVQSELGFTGAGIRVGVIDTGIDVDHLDLGGDGLARSDSPLFPSARVAYGYDFVGDAYNADATSPSYNPIPTPDPNPDDCGGHGTHVAGIIGGNGFIKGVAPEVIFGAYRVFGCQGSTSADIMIAAMERALADGMQIVNMSIVSPYQWPQFPTAQAADRLVQKGVVVVASIGNNGADGLYSASAPALGKNVIGVASYDNKQLNLPCLLVNGRRIGYLILTFSGPAPFSGEGEVVYVGQGCQPIGLDLTGKIALIPRGTCNYYTKVMNAINAGAKAVLIYNNVAGILSGTLGAPIDGVTPVVGISLEDGMYIRNQIAPVTMAWSDEVISYPIATGGLISAFSSYGLSPDLALKPDLGAPGGTIYSSYPVEKGGYTILSGTSMSSPHVAGAAALLLQAKPHTPPQAVRDILQNSADPARWSGNPALGYLEPVHRQGAGLVDIDDAIVATTKITPGKLSLGEDEAGPHTERLTIENNDAAPVTYALDYVNALSTAGLMKPEFLISDARVSFSSLRLTIPAGATAWVDAAITPATGPLYGQYGGYIRLTPTGGGTVYRVPFAGFVGDYQAIQVLAPTTYGFPWLSYRQGNNYYKAPSDRIFTLEGNDVPYVLVHRAHHCRVLRVEVFASPSGKAWHRTYEQQYVARSVNSTGFWALPFDGHTFSADKSYVVPDGQYVLKLSALKALGDDDNPADWETWTSPTFIIDRP